MNDQKLIQLVFNHPMLYDPNHEDYSNTILKKNIWTSIGYAMGSTSDSCRARWTNIRDNFTRSLKKNTFGSAQKTRTGKPYKYSEQMNFLKKIVMEKETSSRTGDMATTEKTSEDGNKNDKEDIRTQSVTQVGSPENEKQGHTVSTPTKRVSSGFPAQLKKLRVLSPERFPPLNTDKNNCINRREVIGSPSVQPHLVDAFLSGIAPVLKNLPPHHWLHAKEDIFKTVHRYERKMLEAEEQSAGPSALSQQTSTSTEPSSTNNNCDVNPNV